MDIIILMRVKIATKRAVTEPTSQKLYDKSSKIQGIVFIEPTDQVNKKSTIIEVKPNEKILFHCYKRYKTFTYGFDAVYEQNQETNLYEMANMKYNAVKSINAGLDYMCFCTGTAFTDKDKPGYEANKGLEFVEGLFYEQLCQVQEDLIQNGAFEWAINVVAIGEDSLLDLAGQRKSIQIREIINNKTPNTSEICLVDCHEVVPETSYQLLQLIKEARIRRYKNCPKSHLAIYIEVKSKNSDQKYKLLLINATKTPPILTQDKNWDSGSSLVLNKCLLGLLNKMENNKDSYTLFRDSRLTRIMKPFLVSNARVDAIGLVNAGDQETPFSTLSLVKNLSRIRIPILKDLEPQVSKINPESIVQMKQKTYQLRSSQHQRQKIIQQVYSPQHHNRKKSLPRTEAAHHTQQSRVSLVEEVRKNAKMELQEQVKLSKVRVQMKMMRKKKDINLSRLLSQDKGNQLEKLEDEELNYIKKKELQTVELIEKLEKNRIQVIQKSISKVEKLKLLKEYYQISIQNQKEQTAQFQKNQHMLAKFYEEKLQQIEKNLKKSPKQLLADNKEEPVIKNKRYESNDKVEKHSLPTISMKNNKRVVYIKEKVKKGRVQYQDFLSKNVSQYKSYLASDADD